MIHLPLRNKAQAQQLSREQGNRKSALYHKWLTPAQFAQRFGPLKSDMAAAAAALRAGGFTIDRTDMQMILAHAPSSSVERFFNTRIGLVRDVATSELKIDARVPVTMPASLARVHASVLQLTAMSRAHSTVQRRKNANIKIAGKNARLTPHANAVFGPIGPYLPGELYQAYGQPAQTYANGLGETIDIVGLSDTLDSENQTLWCYEGLGPSCGGGVNTFSGPTLAPYPSVTHYVSTVPGGCIPPDTDGNSLEAALDIEMAGGTAPGAQFNTFCSDSTANLPFLDAYSFITGNNIGDFVTTSYSICEGAFVSDPTEVADLQAYDDLFVQGVVQGQGFLFSSGDNGAFGCEYLGDQVDTFTSALASDPNVTSVGGTTSFVTSWFDGGLGTGYGSETSFSTPNFDGLGNTWGSGGGVSVLFQTPDYQSLTGLPPGTSTGTPPFGTGRQNPDVALMMGGPVAPDSAVWIYTGLNPGFLTGVIGTSSSSPELAGWLATIMNAGNVARGGAIGSRLGNPDYLFYAIQFYGDAAIGLNQNIPGDDGFYSYSPNGVGNPPGYNNIIGEGTVNQANTLFLVGDLGSYTFAGDLVTTGNP
jgi:subtilase family serine protease